MMKIESFKVPQSKGKRTVKFTNKPSNVSFTGIFSNPRMQNVLLGWPRKIMSKLDFNDGLIPAEKEMMTLYASTIIARLVFSRPDPVSEKNPNGKKNSEFWETLRRDPLGWLSLFFVSPIVQRAMAFTMDKMREKNFILKSTDANGNKVPSIFFTKDGKLPSLKEALNPLNKGIRPRKLSELNYTNAVDKLALNSLKLPRAIIFIAGIGFAISLLGIAIPWFNTKWTAKAYKEDGKGKFAPKMPQPQVNYVSYASTYTSTTQVKSMDDFLKKNTHKS